MQILNLRCFLCLQILYVALPALGNPVPQTDHNKASSSTPPGTCPEEDPPVWVHQRVEEFTVDVGVSQRHADGEISGYFTVRIDPLLPQIHTLGSRIFNTENGHTEEIHPSFAAYLLHRDNAPGQSIYANRWELGINSDRGFIHLEGRDVWWRGIAPRLDILIERQTYRGFVKNAWEVTWHNFRQFAAAVFVVTDPARNRCGDRGDGASSSGTKRKGHPP